MSVGFQVPPNTPQGRVGSRVGKMPTLPQMGREDRVGSFANPAPNLPTLLPTLPYILWSTLTANTRYRKRFTSRNARGQNRIRVGKTANPANPATNPATNPAKATP